MKCSPSLSAVGAVLLICNLVEMLLSLFALQCEHLLYSPVLVNVTIWDIRGLKGSSFILKIRSHVVCSIQSVLRSVMPVEPTRLGHLQEIGVLLNEIPIGLMPPMTGLPAHSLRKRGSLISEMSVRAPRVQIKKLLTEFFRMLGTPVEYRLSRARRTAQL